MKTNTNKYLSLEQVADFLGVDYQLVYRLVRSGELSAIRVGRVYRVSPDDLNQFIERSKTTNQSTVFVCSACGTEYGSKESLSEECRECGAPVCFDCATRLKREYCREHDKKRKKTEERKTRS